MQPPPTSLKIEDLKARVRADVKSRHFYPLAEELRKIGRLEEAEQTLRTGLVAHPTYLSAWISLGKVLRDGGKKSEACDTFLRALTIDPGNVVAARLAADNYLELGEKVEAIKKYKLVHALMPSDEEVETIIDQLDRELNPGHFASEATTPASDVILDAVPDTLSSPQDHANRAGTGISRAADHEASVLSGEDVLGGIVEGEEEETEVPSLLLPEEGEVFGDSLLSSEPDFDADEPMTSESEPGAGDVVDVDGRSGGMTIFTPDEAEPGARTNGDEMAAEPATPHHAGDPLSGSPLGIAAADAAGIESVWDDSETSETEHAAARVKSSQEPADLGDSAPATLTIGDLYAQQGHREAAREIYAKVVEREPENEAAAERLKGLEPDGKDAKIVRLQQWLEKVGKRDSASV